MAGSGLGVSDLPLESSESNSRDTARRVLMIACAFPPTGGPGVQRAAKFAKYLPRMGWRPIVWCVDRMDDFPQDRSLADELPREVAVHRFGCGGLAHGLRRSLETKDGGGAPGRIATALGWRLDRWLRRRAFPDGYAAWARASVRPLLRLIERERIELIWSTFSPASNHLLGLTLKRRTGLPWVADFRDLWTDDYRYEPVSEARRRADRALEKRMLEAADAVIGVTTTQTAALAVRMPNSLGKVHTITNGFDPADFRAASPEPSGARDRFVLAYVGRFDSRRASDPLIDGLARFVDRLGPRHASFVLRFVGHVSDKTRRRLEATGAACEFTGYLDHADAVAEMRQADALLVSVPSVASAETTIPAKPFEYLAAGRPILHVGPVKGESAGLIDACSAGEVVGHEADEIADGLNRLYEPWSRGEPRAGCAPERLTPYSRIVLARKFSAVMNQLVTKRASTEPVAPWTAMRPEPALA